MRSLLIQDVKACTRALFAADSFDSWVFREGKLRRAFDVSFDGDLTASEDEERSPILWESLRPVYFFLLKGSVLPESFSMILTLPEEKTARFLEEYELPFTPAQIASLALNFRYEGAKLHLISAATFAQFVADHSLSEAWDKEIMLTLDRLQIAYTVE